MSSQARYANNMVTLHIDVFSLIALRKRTFVRSESNASLRLNMRLRSLMLAARRCATVATLRRFFEGRGALKPFHIYAPCMPPLWIFQLSKRSHKYSTYHFNLTCSSSASLASGSHSRLFLQRRRRHRFRCSRAQWRRRRGSPLRSNG